MSLLAGTWIIVLVLNQRYKLTQFIYHAGQSMLPIAFKPIKKDIQYSRVVTQKLNRRSRTTKNEDLIFMLKPRKHNLLNWHYVFAESWFSSIANMRFIYEKMEKYFILKFNRNRLIALSKEDKL